MDLLDLLTLSGFSIRLLIAVLLGFLIGLERQWTRHPAGILTSVIVCMGAFSFCAFPIVTQTSGDPTRVAAQVVSGVGFLGAGVILREGLNIKGLNTAATIWATSAVGVLCCVSNIFYAVIFGLALVLCNVIFHPVARFITDKRFKKETTDSEKVYSITVICTDKVASNVRERLMFIIKNEDHVLLKNLSTQTTEDENVKIKAIITSIKPAEDHIERILSLIGIEKSVLASGWKTINS